MNCINKNWIHVLLFIIAPLFITNCSSEHPTFLTPVPECETFFSKGVNFTSDGGSQSIMFSTNRDWTVTKSSNANDISWCTVSPLSGKGGDVKFTISAAASNIYDDRNVTLTLTAGEISKSIIVSQKQKDAIILTSSNIEIPQEGGNISVELKSNCEYEVIMPDVDWIKESSSRSLSSHTFQYTISPNDSYDNRKTQIIYKSKVNSNVVDTLYIEQKKKNALFLQNKNIEIAPKGGDVDVVIESNIDFKINLKDIDWIKENTSSSRGLEKHSKTLSISTNPLIEARSAQVIFENNEYSISDTLLIVQKGNVYHVETAGTLSEIIDNDIKHLISEMKLTGNIDGKDIRYIRQMSSTDGSLIKFDINDVNIVESNYPYYSNGYTSYTTVDNQIGAYMFYQCILEEIILPKDVIIIGNSAFEECKKLSFVQLPKTIKQINNAAFKKCEKLHSIDIPEGLKIISGFAYSGLKNITIPNGVTSIDAGAFNDSPYLKKVIIPESVTHIGAGAFSRCTQLEEAYVPHNVKELGRDVFAICKSLLSANIPNSVTKIGVQTYHGCESIKKATVGNGISIIPSHTFCDCYNLTDVYIEEGVKTIDQYAFVNCNKLTQITIPMSVEQINRYAFRNTALTKMICKAKTPPTLGTEVVGLACEVYVPKESVDLYKSANRWKDYTIKPLDE